MEIIFSMFKTFLNTNKQQHQNENIRVNLFTPASFACRENQEAEFELYLLHIELLVNSIVPSFRQS